MHIYWRVLHFSTATSTATQLLHATWGIFACFSSLIHAFPDEKLQASVNSRFGVPVTTSQKSPQSQPQSKTSLPTDTVQISNAARAALQETVETPAQTAKKLVREIIRLRECSPKRPQKKPRKQAFTPTTELWVQWRCHNSNGGKPGRGAVRSPIGSVTSSDTSATGPV